MTDSYRSKKRVALFKPILDRIRKSDSIPLNEKQIQKINDLEKLFKKAVEHRIIDDCDDIADKVEALLKVDRDVDTDINRETSKLVHFIDWDEDKPGVIEGPERINDEILKNSISKHDKAYMEIVNSDLYILISRLFKSKSMKSWCREGDEPNACSIDSNYEEVLDLWVSIVVQAVNGDLRLDESDSLENIDFSLSEKYDTQEIKYLANQVFDNNKEFEKYCIDSIKKYIYVLLHEIVYLINICLRRYFFEEEDFYIIQNYIKQKKGLNIEDIEPYIEKIDNPDLLLSIKTRIRYYHFARIWRKTILDYYELKRHSVNISTVEGEINLSPVEAAEVVLLRQEDFEIPKTKLVKTSPIKKFNKQKLGNDFINEKFMYLQLDLTYDKKEILRYCDDAITKAQKIIAKGNVDAKIAEKQKIFETIFLPYYLKPMSIEKALKKTEPKLVELGINLSNETLVKRYLKRLRDKYKVSDMRKLRTILSQKTNT